MTPPPGTPMLPSQRPQRWRWPMTPSKAPGGSRARGQLGPPPHPPATCPCPLAHPLQVLLFLQEKEEKSSAAPQVTLGPWHPEPSCRSPLGRAWPRPWGPQPGHTLLGWPQLPAPPTRGHFLHTRLWPRFLHPCLVLPSKSINYLKQGEEQQWPPCPAPLPPAC